MITAKNYKNVKQKIVIHMFAFTSIAILMSIYITNLMLINHYNALFFNAQKFYFYSPTTLYKIVEYFRDSADSFVVWQVSILIKWNAGEVITFATIFIPFFISAGGIIITYARLKSIMVSDRYGTARFLTAREIIKSNKIDAPDSFNSYKKHGRYGLFMGGFSHNKGELIIWEDKETKIKTEMHLLNLYHFGEQHMIIFAPTGSGKTAGVVIEQLTTFPESVFVLDISGELCTTTSGFRSKKFNNVIIRFEPSAPSGSARYNPLEEVRLGTEFELSDAQKIAAILVITPEKDLSDHWVGRSYDLLTHVILHVLYTKKNRNLSAVALFISGIDPDDSNHVYAGENGWLSEMMGMPESKQFPADTNSRIHVKGYANLKGITEQAAFKELLDNGIIGNDGIHINVKATAASLRNSNAAEEKSSIISSAQKPLALYRDPIVSKNTSVSDFKLDDLQNLSRPVSFYQIIPTDQRERLKPLVRLLITQFIHKTQSSMDNKIHELACIWDEFPEFGKIEALESAFATIRKYKVRLVIICQDYLQLVRYYGEHQTIYSNCGIRIAFAPNEQKTADLLSNDTGDMTYIAKTTSYTKNVNPLQVFNGGSTSTNTQETHRKLMTSNEVKNMGNNMLIMIEGQPTILGHKIFWYFSDYFKERVYDIRNPNSEISKRYQPFYISQKIVKKRV